MAVETTHSANAAAPAQSAPGASTAAPAAAPAPMASEPLSFEDLVRQELGEEPSATANPETPKKRSQAGKPAAAPVAAVAEPDPESNPDDNDDDDLGDSDVYGEADDADADADGAVPGDNEDDPEAEPEGEPDEDTELEDLPPEHFKNLPKWVQKRLGKVSATVQDLRSQLAERSFAIAPTPESPLAHVETVEDLDRQVATARQIREWCRQNPDGGQLGTAEFSAEDVAGKLAHAESILDSAPDWRTRVTNRAAQKPWENAKKLCPEMFQSGTPENGIALSALELCPQLKTRVPNWEMFLALAVRGMKQDQEEKTGKVKYVRMEVGTDGKLIPPVKAPASPKPGTKPAPQSAGRPAAAGNTPARPKPPVTPGGSPPPMRSARPGAKPDTSALANRYVTSGEAEDFAALVAAEMS